MKKILLYSSDFILSFSFLMYLQNKYNITTTTDLKDFENIINNTSFDIIMMDAEPSQETESLCRNIHRLCSKPIILFYVYNERVKEFDKKIREYVRKVVYKPFDPNEVTTALDIIAF